MKILGVVLLLLSGGLLYLVIVKKQKPADIWNSLTGFFQPVRAGNSGSSGGGTGTKYSPN